MTQPQLEPRLDQWLWAARFYKTRALAAEAVDTGKVEVNGERAKRGRRVHLGDTIRLRLGPYEHELVVQGLSQRRGPAPVARALYAETEASRVARERRAREIRSSQPLFSHGEGKPSKKDRREILRFKRRRD